MTLQSFDRAAVGLPVTRSGVSLLPVYLAGNPLPGIATGHDSGLVVDELDSACVPTLLAYNPTGTPILAVEGEHFIGGKQNRTLNATVLVPARSKLEIPVSCLEQGRWGHRREYTRSAAFAPRQVRRQTAAGVHESMACASSRRGDQGAVWAAVDEVLARNRVASSTDAAEDLHKARRRDRPWAGQVDEVAGLGPLPEQCGIAVAHGGWIVAIELFGAPHLLAAHWGALVRSYLLERTESGGYPSATRVLRMIRGFGRADYREEQGVGLGVERRVQDSTMTAQALVLDGSVVHASIYTR